MENRVKELTLLLLYLTSWEENDFGVLPRSWKGYPFEVLNELTEEDLIRGSKTAKSVYLTQAGVREAEALAKRYFTDHE